MDALDALSSAVMLAFGVFGTCTAFVFILIVALHRQCHTATIFLVLNSVVAGLVANLVFSIQSVYQLVGDGNDALCILRGYAIHSSAGVIYHTLSVQALHRLFVTVLARRRYLQSKRFLMALVGVQWFFSSCFVLPILLTGKIRYNPGSRICLVGVTMTAAFMFCRTFSYAERCVHQASLSF